MMATAQTPNMDNVVILIPAFNEGRVVKDTVNGLPVYFKHIVCVDDGSSDDTKAQLQQTRAQVVSHPINLGQGAALQTAIDYALASPAYDYFVTYDADGQHSSDDIEKMVAYIRKHPVDIVLGSRFLGQTRDMGWLKKVVLKLAVRFSNLTTGLRLTDAHNGLRVFNRRVARGLRITMPDMAHASEINQRIAEKNFAYAEAPTTITYTDYSKAKGQSTINSVNILFDLLLHGVIKK